MIVGLSLFETEEYISDRDTNKLTNPDQATKFIIGALDVDIQAKIGDRAMVMENTGEGTRFYVNAASRNLEACRCGLKGWRNFKDSQGNDIPFETTTLSVNGKSLTVVSDASMARLPVWLRTEIGQRVLDTNELRSDQEKNLQMP